MDVLPGGTVGGGGGVGVGPTGELVVPDGAPDSGSVDSCGPLFSDGRLLWIAATWDFTGSTACLIASSICGLNRRPHSASAAITRKTRVVTARGTQGGIRECCWSIAEIAIGGVSVPSPLSWWMHGRTWVRRRT